MLKRQQERVALEMEATLYFSDKTDFICQTLDVSVGGMKVSYQDMKALFPYIGSDCIVEFLVEAAVGIEDKELLLQTKAMIVNGDLKGVGLKFEGVDKETLVIIDKLVSRQLKPDDLACLETKHGVSMRATYAKALKTQLEEHIVAAVKDVFIAFLSIDVVPGPYMERHDFYDYKPPETEITGIVLFGGALEGGIHLASPLHFAVQSAGAMLGEAGLDLANEQEEMVWDAFGEITNQVAGGVQTRISNEFEDINLTAPNIVSGRNFRINYNKNLSSVRQFFRSPFGPFFVECFFS